MPLPPSLRDWVPADHLVPCIIDAVESIDLRRARVNWRGSGSEASPPAMMLALRISSDATGAFDGRGSFRAATHNVGPDQDERCARGWGRARRP